MGAGWGGFYRPWFGAMLNYRPWFAVMLNSLFIDSSCKHVQLSTCGNTNSPRKRIQVVWIIGGGNLEHRDDSSKSIWNEMAVLNLKFRMVVFELAS